MRETTLNIEIAKLPLELKKEVADFVDFLKTKTPKVSEIKEREFGYAKGKIHLSDDFDEPLEEFNNYM